MKQQQCLPVCNSQTTVMFFSFIVIEELMMLCLCLSKCENKKLASEGLLVKSQTYCGDVVVPGCNTVATVKDVFKKEILVQL